MQDQGMPVLLVEDEALIRMMLAGEFEDAGFRVHEAGSADDAVALLESGVEVALVVTDIRMPGRLDGLGLVAWLADHRPGLPVLIVSGYATPPRTENMNAAIAAVLSKPYNPTHIVSLVADLIAGDAAKV